MAFDLFQSRRNMNERCRWWTRNESDDYEDNELVYKRVPNGMFYAKEANAETVDNNIIGGIIRTDKYSITIMSADDLKEIKSDDLVEFQNEIWRVESVQKRKARIQNTEFSSIVNVSHYWYLTLIK